MSATDDHAAVTNTLLTVEEGDEIRLRARYYDWKRPLRVVSVQEIAWQTTAGEGWRTRTLSVDTDRSSHEFDVVEGIGITDSTLSQGHGPVESVERVEDGPEPLGEPTDPDADWWSCPPVATRIDESAEFSRLGEADEEEDDDREPVNVQAAREYHEDRESKADLAADIREHAGEDAEPNRESLSKADLIQVGLRCDLAESIIGYPARTIVAELEDELGESIETGSDGKPTRDGLETLRDAFLDQIPEPGQDDFRGMMSTGGASW